MHDWLTSFGGHVLIRGPDRSPGIIKLDMQNGYDFLRRSQEYEPPIRQSMIEA
jgi:hypothetical protein